MSTTMHSSDHVSDQVTGQPMTPRTDADGSTLDLDRTHTITVISRPNRAPGFENRYPILFDRRADIPGREVARWGPACLYLIRRLLIPAFVIILVALAAIAWYTL